jgi:hypothetical protein
VELVDCYVELKDTYVEWIILYVEVSVFRSVYYFGVWIRGSVILNYGSGSNRQIDYGSAKNPILSGHFWQLKIFYQIRTGS